MLVKNYEIISSITNSSMKCVDCRPRINKVRATAKDKLKKAKNKHILDGQN